MPRLLQSNPGNYGSGRRINDEFENIIRYINSAELGDKTLSELLKILFDNAGNFRGPIELRLDTIEGLQYRIGTYTDPEAGWLMLAALETVRGPAGASVGTLTGPLISGRQDFAGTGAQTVFNYVIDTGDDILVFVNGILQRVTTHYTFSAAADTVTFVTAPANGALISIMKIRAALVPAYSRTDILAANGQVLFPFVHADTDVFIVFKNGILQRPGGGFDYVNDPNTDTIVFTTPCALNDLITLVKTDDTSVKTVTGLLTEDAFTNGSGLIPWSKLAVENSQIPAEKVFGLAELTVNKYPTYIGSSPPIGPQAGWMWLDTSSSPNILNIYNGAAWVPTRPDTTLPDFTLADALKYVRVNGSGTAYELGAIDLTSAVQQSQIGAANGVASLDASSLIPVSQLPDAATNESYFREIVGSVSNGTFNVIRLWKQRVTIDGIVRRLSAGTCDVTIQVDGSDVGTAYAANSTLQSNNLSPTITIDATTTSRLIGIRVANATSASNLEVCLAASVIG